MRIIFTAFVIMLFTYNCFSADFSYEPADSGSLVAGTPARAARVLSMFNSIKNYINVVSGAWVNTGHLIAGAVTGVKTAAAIAGDGLVKDGSSNIAVNIGATSGLSIDTDYLNVNYDDSTLGVNGSNELIVKDGGITATQLSSEAVTTAKIDAGAVTNDKIADATIESSKLSETALQLVMPAGTILPYGGPTAPTGYLLCDGTAVSRTTYATLFSIIGTSYGTGDNISTFNVPNMVDNFMVGAGSTYSNGDTGGTIEVTLTGQQSGIQNHNHNIHVMEAVIAGAASLAVIEGSRTYNADIISTSSGNVDAVSAHENRPPYLGVTFIIKY